MTIELDETAPGARADDVSGMLRRETSALHRRAERSGVVADILAGAVTRGRYALFLRNLVPAYARLERGLDGRRASPGVGALARPEVYRSAALAADLTDLGGPDWARELPLLPAAARYADRVDEAAAESEGGGLIGHAYVRYLGDLSGGQVLKRKLARSLGLPPGSLTVYDFPAITDLDAYKHDYRAAIDQACQALADPGRVIAAALEAFRLNIEVSEAVRRAPMG